MSRSSIKAGTLVLALATSGSALLLGGTAMAASAAGPADIVSSACTTKYWNGFMWVTAPTNNCTTASGGTNPKEQNNCRNYQIIYKPGVGFVSSPTAGSCSASAVGTSGTP